MIRSALALLLALGACTGSPPAPVPSAIADEPPQAAVSSPSREERAIVRHLGTKDAAMNRGDRGRLEELLDPAAPSSFRDAQVALLVTSSQRPSTSFAERVVLATRSREGLLEAEILERDDQGRARQRRVWFSGPLDELRQTEPALASLGQERVEERDNFRFVYRDLDRPQVEVARSLGEEWLRSYATRLGEAYAPRGRIEVRFAPTQDAWPGGLPAVASAAVSRGVFYVLSSTAMLAEGEAATFAKVIVGHELAHVLLGGRPQRAGGFLLSEGLPLWLTQDTRELELGRLVARDELWTLDHLLAGPQTEVEFYAAYAQASSFVRFVADRYGEPGPLRLWEASTRSASFDVAARVALGAGGGDVHRAWQEATRAMPRVPASRRAPALFDAVIAH